jgi:hypothetical protein
MDERCSERIKLKIAVSKAVAASYAAYQGDARNKARLSERDAVKVLQAHIGQHGCRTPQLGPKA